MSGGRANSESAWVHSCEWVAPTAPKTLLSGAEGGGAALLKHPVPRLIDGSTALAGGLGPSQVPRTRPLFL